MLNTENIRGDFPLLHSSVDDKPLIYLDNAATMQLPRQVLAVLEKHYFKYNANVHRGIHYLSEMSTAHYEAARETVRRFIGARYCHEIIFTKGTTDSINLVANSFGEAFVNAGDEILVSAMEHHSNWMPWQMLCRRRGANLKVIPINRNGDLNLTEYQQSLSSCTKLIAVSCVSNVLGTVNPLEKIISIAHAAGIPVLVDGAQSLRHSVLNMEKLECDFFCFSGHKIMAPIGIGVLYGKEEWLDKLPPVQFGGGMVEKVGLFNVKLGKLPLKFEAGTPNYASAIALEAALLYLDKIGRQAIAEYESELLQNLINRIATFSNIQILGKPIRRAGVLSFTMDTLHPYDVAVLLDKQGIAVRAGHHCAQPLLDYYGLDSTVRISPAFYNTNQEIDRLIEAIGRITRVAEMRINYDDKRNARPHYR